MPNILYKDTSLATRYLQAFLQNEEDNTLRASGIYDEYTHNALITYMELPVVVDSNVFYNRLITKYPKIPDYFKIDRAIDMIILECRVIDDIMVSYVNVLREDIYEFVNSLGWSITKFVSFEDNSEIIRIELSKDVRKNLIPKSAIAMINQNIDRYLEDTGFVNGKLDREVGKCVCIIPCLPNHTYTIFVEAPTCFTATSDSTSKAIFDTLTTLTNITEVDLRTESSNRCYQKLTTTSTDHTILVETSYTDYTTYPDIYKEGSQGEYPAIWVLDITSYPQTNFEKYDDKNQYSLFRDNWSINSKFFDYLYGMAISEYSPDMNISYAQDLLNKLYPSYIMKVSGIWSTLMTTLIRNYQLANGIIFSIGCIDAETESLMLKDIEDQKEYGGLV